jgi:hypothetical protein
MLILFDDCTYDSATISQRDSFTNNSFLSITNSIAVTGVDVDVNLRIAKWTAVLSSYATTKQITLAFCSSPETQSSSGTPAKSFDFGREDIETDVKP